MKRAVQSPARLKPEAVWAMVSEERRRLLEYLRVLPEEAWDKQSLCRGWKVRHVVAHVILESRYGMLRSLPRWVRHGLSFNRFMYHSALGFGAQGRLELLMALQEDLDKRIAPPLISPLQVLTD
ncbi:MAG TPA: maleylpyruvate isomerase N-terminal domain-containing protein, partial [Candidatus Saccharimonas sp.]|nr:maleylpyruvate isomerase N-terminal domain-containing protein [Candidatus Saccharimonas sp.]